MPEITLKCFVIGENLNNSFKVDIKTSDTVSELKTKIWNKKQNAFTYDRANHLKLWKVDISPKDEKKREILRNRNRINVITDLEGKELLKDTNIRTYWHSTGSRQPIENHINVIVKGNLINGNKS